MSISLFLVLGCEKDLYDDSIKNDISITIKEATLKDLLKKPIFNTAYSKVQSKTQELKNANARTELEDQYNFTITDDAVVVMETNDSIKSYTFLIERETETNDYFENLVIQIDPTGDIDALIMKYTPTSPDLSSFEGTKEVTPLIQSERVIYLSNGCMYISWVTCHNTVPGNPLYNEPHTPTSECTNPSYYNHHYGLVCPDDITGGGNPIPTPTNGNPPSNGGSSSGSVITNPNPPKNAASKKFIKNLTTPGSPNYNADREECYEDSSPAFKAALSGFLDRNIDTTEMDGTPTSGTTTTQTSNEQFANEAIDAQCSGGEVDFDNQVIIDASLKDNPCLYSVYVQLGKAPTFKNYLKNFDGNFSVANLKLNVGVHPEYPTANAVTSPPANYLITIMFNPNNLNRPQLDVARTFIHEMIHAEIFRKLLSCANLPNLNTNDYTDLEWRNYITSLHNNFPGLYDYYIRYVYNIPIGQQATSIQHELMAQHYREIIIQTMQQFDNTQTPEIYNALSWTGLMGEGDLNPTTGLLTNSTIAWQNIPQAQRLQILSISNNFLTTEEPCQP